MAEKGQRESERQTRQRRIDPKLKAAGWQIVREHDYDPSRPFAHYNGCAIEEYPTESGPADYALIQSDRILGIVEAKKVSLGPQNVLTQSERYSKGASANPLNFRGFHVPFLYSTNGEVIWYHDVRHPLSRSRKISHFHTPAALSERFHRDLEQESDELAQLPNDNEWLRPYQIGANAGIEQALRDRKRQMLVAMATGTGKTFTMVNQVYRLMKSGVGQRILFLVDRRALAAQAVRAFASFEAEPGLKFDKIYEVYSQRFKREDFDEDDPFDPKVLPSEYLLNPKPAHAFVYVSTIQRMTINLFGRNAIFSIGDEELDEDAGQLDIPIHAFEVIIADECHRGYTSAEVSVWRNTLDHFDATKIGLTATPAAHTAAYFRELVFRYEYETAVREGYLVDYDVVNVRSDVRMEGVFLEEGEAVGNIDPETGLEQMDLLEDERQFESEEVERKVTSPDSNRKILEEIRKYALEHEQEHGRFPKTLIFAANDIPHTSHADCLVDIARDVFGQGDDFVQKITGRADRPLQRIREFRNRPNPKVVVTVDMLSTGVDIPDLEFIVFLRTVKSRILFEQMIGRGTRKGENCPDKSHFTVFDCFDGTLFRYFKSATAITAHPPEKPYRTIVEIIEDIWSNRDRDYNTRCLVKRVQRIDKQMSGEARERFAAYLEDGDVSRYAQELPRRLRDDFTGTMALLRDPGFQDLLQNYPRAPRSFVVAYGTEDTVTSEALIRDSAGREHKPDDYLAAFVRFVNEHAYDIEALRILLNRPQEWGTDILTELRNCLARATEGFTVENLQKAHQLRYQKALVDIISMIKHAAKEEEPLYTAQERVARVFERLRASQQFTDEQELWLHRIETHLVENLTIDPEDFEDVPVFSRAGGWGRANRAFDGRLREIIKEINAAIAA